MDLVTVTDHDSIDAVEELRRYPDFFLSEEVTCTMPSGTEMHAGVYGIEERDHVELQRRRHDVESLLAYAADRRLFVTVNHFYTSLTGRRTDDDFIRFARDFHGVETINGMMLACANELAIGFARRHGKPGIGGSDAHTLGAVARTYTEVPGAASIQEFLAGMCHGNSIATGESGSYWKLTAAVCGIGTSFIKSRLRYQPWIAPAGAILAFAPAVILANYFREVAFARHWGQRHALLSPVAASPVAVSQEFAG
jgi:hypothetical protein